MLRGKQFFIPGFSQNNKQSELLGTFLRRGIKIRKLQISFRRSDDEINHTATQTNTPES